MRLHLVKYVKRQVVRATMDFLKEADLQEDETVEPDSQRLYQQLRARLEDVERVDAEDLASIQRSIGNSSSAADAVHNLVRTRVRDELARQMFTSSLPDMEHYALPAQTRVMTPFALQIIGELSKVVRVNRKVYFGEPPGSTTICGSIVANAAQRLLEDELHAVAAAGVE